MKLGKLLLTAIFLLNTSCGTKSSEKPKAKTELVKPSPDSSEPTPVSTESTDATPAPTVVPSPEPAAPTPVPNVDPEPEQKTIYGTWILPEVFGDESFKMRLFMKFEAMRMTVTAECTSNGLKVYAVASSRVILTTDEVQVVETANSEEIQNGVRCKINIPMSTFQYKVDGDFLKIDNDGQQETLARLNESEAPN